MTNLHLTVEVPGSIFGAGKGRPDCILLHGSVATVRTSNQNSEICR